MFDSLGVDVETSDVSFSISHDKGNNGYEWCSQYGFSNYFAQKKKLLNPFNWQSLREIIKFGNDVESYLGSLENNPDIDRTETLEQFINSKGYSENFQNTYLLFGQPQWLTIKGHSHFVKRVREVLETKGCQFKLGCEVQSVLPVDNGTTMVCGDGFQETYNGCIMAVDAPTALKLLGNQATFEETRVLGAFQYATSDIFLHRDSNLMPQNKSAWSALNFLNSSKNNAFLTYWLNALQNIGKTSEPFFLTVNPDHTPKNTLLKWSTGHAIPSVAASKASLELGQIQGKRGIWFCGEIFPHEISYDFNQDELKAGMDAAHGILGKHSSVLHSPKNMSPSLPKNMSPSFMETTARLFVTKFFQQYILVANKENSAASGSNKRRTWWSPALLTASISSAKYFVKHLLRQNTITQARRNISRHYDLSNELFSLYLGKMMQYSSGVFRTRIEKWHEVLDIGCGWGSLAIETVKRTGCKYTGITLSEQQLKYAQEKVKEAGLQDNIKILLCDYRQLPKEHQFDRIISVEMVEHVGEEYIEEFYRCCDQLLKEDGLFVLQFISIPEELSKEIQQTAGFLKEYIFPGGTLLSLDRNLSAMAATTRFSVEHVENIGMSYYHTLRWWRKLFLENTSKVLALGFDEKFMRTWEYYFDYCAAGFKTGTLIDYQVVFSRAGNFGTLGDPYKGFPSAYSFMDD
ncbi:Mycolic acid cyclopropane synthase [Gossypium australe]|uniref:Mycolic acid cyclopropane synthase n=1 Tax=Gossypium australe TaxID=47621 RepID=A0A5B6VFE5_9ROSI|nr:Mycolic acid cyclopropane synthase [Gossypium australe]